MTWSGVSIQDKIRCFSKEKFCFIPCHVTQSQIKSARNPIQGRIPMLRGPRHISGAGPLPLFCQSPPSIFLSSFSFSAPTPLFCYPLTLCSNFYFFIFSSFSSFSPLPPSSPSFFQYLNAPPGGPAGPPEWGPRHVPFVPLRGSGTDCISVDQLASGNL